MLAAGRSSRMGSAHKLLLPFPDEHRPVVRGSVETAIEAAVGPVALVVPSGPLGASLSAAVDDLPVRPLANPDAARGISTSVRAALGWARDRAGALLLLLADEPGVRVEAIHALVDAWPGSSEPALRVRYRDRPGHPVLLRLEALEGTEGGEGASAGDDETLVGDTGLNAWLSAGRVRPVEVDLDAPIDIDTRRDYQAALARLPR